MDNTNVVISPREMYELLQEVAKSLQKIESRLDVLEGKVEGAYQADERSREALRTIATLEKRVKTLERKHDRISWAFTSAFIIGAVGALFYFAQLGIGG